MELQNLDNNLNLKFKCIEAPLYKINGEPAYIAGEWEGHRSNKFERTRKCIRTNDVKNLLDGCDFYNSNPQRRHFSLKSYEEKGFKPCMKTFKEAYYTSKDIDKEKDIWPSKKSELAINLEPKKNYFNYRDNYNRSLLKKFNEMKKKIVVQDEVTYLAKIGMLNNKEEFVEKLSKTEQKHSNVKKKNTHDYLNQKREVALLELKIKMENMKKDIEYIKSLNSWDTKFIRDLNNESN